MLDRVANNLKKVVSPISGVLTDISMVVTVLVILIVVVDVILRRLFNAPIRGGVEISSVAFSIIVFLPLAWGALKNAHIELDFVVKKFRKTPQCIIEVVMTFLSTIMLGLMSWQIMVQGTKLQAAHQTTSVLRIPMYPFLYIATFGSIILTLAFMIKFIYALNNIIKERR